MIERLYCKRYVGSLRIERAEGCPPGWRMAILNPDRPLRLQFQGDEDGFLKFVEKELRARRLDHVEYYSGYKVPPDESPSCGCKK